MLTSGQFTMNPVDWKVSLAAPDGVMLCACVPTSASARAKSVCRTRLDTALGSFDDDNCTPEVPAALASFGTKFTPRDVATDRSEASVMT
jgi:hypothetical protein